VHELEIGRFNSFGSLDQKLERRVYSAGALMAWRTAVHIFFNDSLARRSTSTRRRFASSPARSRLASTCLLPCDRRRCRDLRKDRQQSAAEWCPRCFSPASRRALCLTPIVLERDNCIGRQIIVPGLILNHGNDHVFTERAFHHLQNRIVGERLLAQGERACEWSKD
jgi:hypothetical protein